MSDDDEVARLRQGINAVAYAMAQFIMDPGDQKKFDAADWACKVFSVRWDKYATGRRCAGAACWRPTVAPSSQSQ